MSILTLVNNIKDAYNEAEKKSNEKNFQKTIKELYDNVVKPIAVELKEDFTVKYYDDFNSIEFYDHKHKILFCLQATKGINKKGWPSPVVALSAKNFKKENYNDDIHSVIAYDQYESLKFYSITYSMRMAIATVLLKSYLKKEK